MCFRPAEVSMNTCEVCGAVNKPIAKECAQCGAPLAMKKADFDADQAALDSANVAFKAPAAPAAPGAAPKAPMAPAPGAVPKAPASPAPKFTQDV